MHADRPARPGPARPAGTVGHAAGATGRTVVVTPDPDLALTALDGQVEGRDGERLLVRVPDPAALNAGSSRPGSALPSSVRAPHPRGGRRGAHGRPVRATRCRRDPRRAGQALRSTPDLGRPAAAHLLPTVVAGLLAWTRLAPRRAPVRRSCRRSSPTGRSSPSPRWPSSCALPAHLGGGRGRRGDRRRGPGGTLRYLLVRPVGRTRLLVRKLVAVTAFVLSAVVSVAGVGFLVGRLLLGKGHPPGRHGQPVGLGPHPRRHSRGARSWRSSTSPSRCSASPRWASSCRH